MSEQDNGRGEARGELARVDAKTASLAAITTLMLTIGSTALITIELPEFTVVFGWAGVLLLIASLILMVLALRPQLPHRDSVLWVVETPIEMLSRMARRKFRLVRYACDLILLACGCGVVALAVAALP